MEMRLNKAVAASGICSRRKADELIFNGHVQVNGKVTLEPFLRVNIHKDKIVVDGHQTVKQVPKLYYLLNKPKGYLCSNARHNNEHIVLDLFPKNQQNLFTVGRLDRDSTGLLLVTNDGDFANQVIHPSSDITKEYVVKVTKEVFDDHLFSLSKGGFIEGTWVKPTKVQKLRRGTVKITVKQGRKREIRVLCEKAGLEVLELKRIRIGSLHLGSIPEGCYRVLTAQDKEAIFQ
jgi:23S rRNA pseudouridine2605 synthase